MKRKKEQWQPKIKCFREVVEDGETKLVEFDPETFEIPANHPVYNTLKSINKKRMKEQTA